MLSSKSVFESAFDIAIWKLTALLSNSVATSVNGHSYDDTSMRSSKNLDAISKIDAAHDDKLLMSSIRVVHGCFFLQHARIKVHVMTECCDHCGNLVDGSNGSLPEHDTAE
jgi:hypothetical protein